MPSVTVTVEGKIVDIPAHLMEEMRQSAMDAFERAEPVGEEIAGLLFGRKTELGWTITAWRPIPREDASRPAVPLSDSEEEAAGEILWEYKTDRQLRGTEPVGWLRSRSRGMAALVPEDAQVCRRFFGTQRCLAVILRPGIHRPMTAAFFDVDSAVARGYSLRGVEITVLADPTAMEAEHRRRREAFEARMTQDRPLFVDFHEPPPPERNWMKLGLGALGGAFTVALALFFLLDRPLHLDAEVRRSRIILHWNREAGFMTGATGAEIDVAGEKTQLTLAELRSGQAFASAPSGDFKLTLRLLGPYAKNQRSILTVVRPPGYSPE